MFLKTKWYFKSVIKRLTSIKTTQTEVLLSTEISGLNEDTESKASRRTEEEDENCGKLNKNRVEAIRNFTLSSWFS